MTKPLLEPPPKRENWLLRYVALQQLYDKEIITALQHAAIDAGEAADKWNRMNIGDRTKRYQFNLVKKEISLVIKDLYQGLVPIINKGQQDAAEAAAKAALAQDAKVLRALFPDNNDRKHWQASFITSARNGVHAMVTRITKSKIPLSKRVYRSGAMASGSLERQINSALARGASVKELADTVRKSIRPDTPGGVSYAAMRLGRSEINNAFHAISISNAEESPWVNGMEWHLSKVHKKNPGDLCEKYAKKKKYPTKDVPPKPHPQCMCYVTPISMEWSSFKSKLKSGGFDDYFEKKYGMPAA